MQLVDRAASAKVPLLERLSAPQMQLAAELYSPHTNGVFIFSGSYRGTVIDAGTKWIFGCRW